MDALELHLPKMEPFLIETVVTEAYINNKLALETSNGLSLYGITEDFVINETNWH